MALLNFMCSNLKASYNQWSDILKPQLKHGNVKPLQLVLRHVMLRRIKRLTLKNLPDITHHNILVPLKPPAQKYYDHQFEKFLKNCHNENPSTHLNKEQSFFSYLHSLRGICDHPLLSNPNLRLTDDGEIKMNDNDANQLITSSRSCQTINHHVSYEECCQSKKIVQLCEMVDPHSPLMKENTKVVIFSTWTRFLDL